jgi:hypothetical protein
MGKMTSKATERSRQQDALADSKGKTLARGFVVAGCDKLPRNMERRKA